MVENRDLLMSIQSQWVYKICNRIKTIEVRKTKSKYDPKFRIFIYCTKNAIPLYKSDVNKVSYGINFNRPDLNLNGKIIGHCTCPEIKEFKWDEINNCYDISDDDLAQTCLTQEQLYAYGKGKTLYGYVLSTFMMYAGPCDISEAYQTVGNNKVKPLKVAPQSWGYIAGVGLLPSYDIVN